MRTPKANLTEIAAVDLGSNSFRLQLAKVEGEQLIFHDSLRDAVRLGAGLNDKKELSADAQERAIHCLKKFGERLRGLSPQAVRAVATNTFRVAKNSAELMQQAQSALGFPIEIIGGREEARLIYIGVSRYLPASDEKRLVIDIGGGSTEFIIGQDTEPKLMESLFMGCVSFTMRFFPDGKLSAGAFEKADTAAKQELESIRQLYTSFGWDQAMGSSGTAKALGEILETNGWGSGDITLKGLQQLRKQLIKAGDVKQLNIPGLSGDRAGVIAGGLSIMLAAFESLGIQSMRPVNTALREGVLYDLLGRMSNHDTRDETVRHFMRRYHVDTAQAKRVQKFCLDAYHQVSPQIQIDDEIATDYLKWAAMLHEIGASISHTGYQKHSAYIIENADMPGFSRKEQALLGVLVRAQRRSLHKINLPALGDDHLVLIAILRLSILFNRNRVDDRDPQIDLTIAKDGFSLGIDKKWLRGNPLTEAELINEKEYWQQIGVNYRINRAA